MVTLECPTVGITGGCTQSPLSTAFGFSADNKLEFEGLTAEGKFVAVNPSSPEHVDLFWALSCSDSGNHGIVVSVTLKAHPDVIISAASFTIAEPYLDYSAVVNAWYAALPDMVGSGIMATYYAEKDLIDGFPITGYNRTQVYLEDALAPFIESMAAMNVSLQPNYAQFASYHDHYGQYYWPPASRHLRRCRAAPHGWPASSAKGSSDCRSRDQRNTPAGCSINRASYECVALRRPYQKSNSTAAPACGRHVCLQLSLLLQGALFKMLATQDNITDVVMPIIEQVTPNAGA